MNFEFIKILTELPGTSGDEGAVRDFILSQIKEKAAAEVDPLGNIVAFKKGRLGHRDRKTAFFAHMDEVGIMAAGITKEGYIRFDTVGGVEPLVLAGKHLIFKSGLTGVIGLKPVHLTEKSEKNRTPDLESLMVDIGADSREEALKLVRPGDTAVFKSKTIRLGNNCIAGKALDDRLGCALLIEMIEQEPLYDTHFVFTVNEETGTWGARAASASLEPDVGIVIETTTAADVDENSGDDRVTGLGLGPVISYMDRGTRYDSALYADAVRICTENSIPWQTKLRVAGGNDSRAVQTAASGAAVLAVSMAARNLHSPNNVVCIDDYDNTLRLAEELNNSIV